MEHRSFSYARKSKKIDFSENLHFQRLQRTLLCDTHQHSLESCRGHANQPAVANDCMRSSRWSTGMFICMKIEEYPVLQKFASSTIATQVAASKPVRITPRACKSTGSCKWLHAQLPMEHR